jgi:hypothetical protein
VKLREIFRYEVGYRFRSGATWAYFGMLLFVGFWMFLATADGAEAANAPSRIAGGGLIIGMFGLMVTAALFADAALRPVVVDALRKLLDQAFDLVAQLYRAGVDGPRLISHRYPNSAMLSWP